MINRIEFMGLPGSGKTTLCLKVYEELKNEDRVNLYKNAYQNSLKLK